MTDKLLILPTASALIGREWVTLQKGQAAPFYDSRLSFYVVPVSYEDTVHHGPQYRVYLDRSNDSSNPVYLQQFLEAFLDLKDNVDDGAMRLARKAMSLAASIDVLGGRIITVIPDIRTDGFGYGKGQYLERPLRIRDILPRMEELADDTGELDLTSRHSDMPSAMLWQGDGERPKKVKGDGRYLHEASVDVPVWAHHDLPTCVNFKGSSGGESLRNRGKNHPDTSALYERWMLRGNPVVGLKGDKPNKRLVSCKDAAASPIEKIAWADWTILDYPRYHWDRDCITDQVLDVLSAHQEAHEAALSGVYVPSPLEEGDLYPANGGTSFSNPV